MEVDTTVVSSKTGIHVVEPVGNSKGQNIEEEMESLTAFTIKKTKAEDTAAEA